MAEFPQSEVIYFIVIGTLGMLSLTIGIAVFMAVYQRRMIQEQVKRRNIEMDYQQKMIQSQIESQEKERKRIAADLHDSIGSLLWAAKLNIAFLGRSVDLNNDLKESYDETMNILDQSIESVKRISWELTPEAFQHSGLSSSIKELCNRLNGKGQQLCWKEEGNAIFWRDSRALMVFRIVQELVNNAVKHASASTIWVELIWNDDSLTITVTDDGVGFVLDDKIKRGVGWWNITHRADRIDAKIKISDNIQKGSSIEIKIPLISQV